MLLHVVVVVAAVVSEVVGGDVVVISTYCTWVCKTTSWTPHNGGWLKTKWTFWELLFKYLWVFVRTF